ncbi:hypothetical protein GCM10010297_12180 [Streptomyces malachitofuscus]|nr:hypothetical protein GCM10010297_12180 [Streptomyces malachitofuscus]
MNDVMNDVRTNEAQSVEDGQAAAGHGRHRGPVSTQDAETSPRGRHRRPAQENEPAESAA